MVLFVLIGVAAGLGIKLYSNKGKTSNTSDVCLTKGCVQLSAQIASRLNTSVDPCEDFVEFACGGWRKKNVIPPGIQAYTCVMRM